MESDRELFAQIAADPDAAAPYLVLADALQQRGDPRGELIAIQHALESATQAQVLELRRREGDAMLAHDKTWIGIPANQRTGLVVRWRYGFIHTARILLDRDPRSALEALLAIPEISSTLAELRLGPVTDRTSTDDWPALAPVLDMLRARWPGSLRRLYLNEGDVQGQWMAPAIVVEGLGALDTLVVHSREIVSRALPPLRRLELRSPSVLLATIPASETLEELTICSRTAKDLDALTPQRFPRLRSLALVGTNHTDQLVRELARIPIASQLDALDLTGGTLTDAGLSTLQKIANHCTLDLDHNLLETLPRSSQRIGSTGPAELVEPTSTYAHRLSAWLSVVRTHEQQEKRGSLIELAHEWERELPVECVTSGAKLYQQIGVTCDELEDMPAAEAWTWLAVHSARWYSNSREEQQASARLATLRMRQGNPAGAAPILAKLATQYQEQGFEVGVAWALRQQGNVELTRSDFGRAESFYTRALAIYRKLDDRESTSLVLSELSGVYWSRGDFKGAEKMLREAVTMGDPESVSIGSTYYNLGALLNGANRIEEAREVGELSLATFRRHGHRGGEGQALSLLGEISQRTRDPQKARVLLDEALACHREVGATMQRGVTLGNLSRVALDLGEYELARAYCEEAIEIHREVGNRYNEGLQLTGIADALIGDGALDEARLALDRACVPARAIKNAASLASIYLRYGIVEHLAGRLADARVQYARCATEASNANFTDTVGWAEMWVAVTYAQEDLPLRAKVLLASARSAIPRDDVQGNAALAMAAAVIARLAGATIALPEPRTWDERILATLVR